MATNLTALLDGPAAAPPFGIISNLENPPNQKIVNFVLPSLFIAVSTLVVAVHLYTKMFVTRRFGLSDYSILLGFGAFVGFCVMCIRAGQVVPGVHMWDVRLKNLSEFLYYLHIASILYAPTIFMIKLSILSQYIQVFIPHKEPRGLYWSTVVLIVANLANYLVLLGLQIWSCTPVKKAWDTLIPGHCIDVLALNICASTVNVVSDIVILLLPQAIIWRLHMPVRQKWAVSSVFFIAILAIASAAVRLYYTVLLKKSSDVTWYSWLTGVWALLEMQFGIIVACMPSAAAFVRSIGQSSWYHNISTSLKSLTGLNRRTGNKQKKSGYVMQGRKGTDEPTRAVQDKPWGCSYKVSGLNAMALSGDTESAHNLTASGL